MKTRKHIHQEAFDTSPAKMFQSLITPSAIQQWWGAERAIIIPETNGVWAATWGKDQDSPDYITVARIRNYSPPNTLTLCDYQYRSSKGPMPFEADFEVTFSISDHETGILLRVEQDGFPASRDADEYMEACVTGWTETFANLQKYHAHQPTK